MISTDIDLYKHDPEILQLTVEQIHKDFQVFSIRLLKDTEDRPEFEELKRRLLRVVDVLLEEHHTTFASLLYRIDLPEELLHKLFQGSEEASISEQLTNIIIKREMLKVVFRKYWGKQQ